MLSDSSVGDLVMRWQAVSVKATVDIRIQSLGWKNEKKVRGQRWYKGRMG